ncbi:bifunctional phosphoribosylaminoimidazolecarboxamide formyltransferase/IMP cyclohydrolase [Mycoplasmatota bacterium]|nr:bifunctional phosphoribosylaminoimidazolecarboxamide formyltransferase/IMP cyclohydrolase [Mycoplasmatota bacterium]
MKYALISVSDKTNIVEFARELVSVGFKIISTGGTKKIIDEAGIETIAIDDFTGFPEMLDGRVKTLHPLVHGGLLSVRDNDLHIKEVKENNIKYIDLVVVNLYPFKETIAKDNVTYADAIENIDIGGPSMLRSAAKNHKFVTVVCDSSDYDLVIGEFKDSGDTSIETRSRLAAKVFRHTASYDTAIAGYLTNEVKEENPESITISYDLKQVLRYGENPHQKATFYKGSEVSYSLAHANQLHGKELSYNNIQDGNAALQIVKEYKEPAVVAVKHMNPCGVGLGNNINEAWDKAYASDPVSIFGGIVSTNQEVTKEVALKMKEIFLEIIIAPSFSDGALEVLTKKKNLRLITAPMSDIVNEKQFISVNGGLLVQDIDYGEPVSLDVVTKRRPTDNELRDLLFAWRACKHVKSNAILLAKDLMTVGIGPGQTSRVGAAKIAFEWAKEHGHNENLVLASDAFFPFDDVVRMANEYGVKAIIQPGGSKRDIDSIKACDELGIAMIFTKMRHFKH